MIACVVPGSTRSETALSASRPPKRTVTSFTASGFGSRLLVVTRLIGSAVTALMSPSPAMPR